MAKLTYHNSNNRNRSTFDGWKSWCYIRYKISVQIAAIRLFRFHLFVQRIMNRSIMPTKYCEVNTIKSVVKKQFISKQPNLPTKGNNTNRWRQHKTCPKLRQCEAYAVLHSLDSVCDIWTKLSIQWVPKRQIRSNTGQWYTLWHSPTAMMVFAKFYFKKINKCRLNIGIYVRCINEIFEICVKWRRIMFLYPVNSIQQANGEQQI